MFDEILELCKELAEKRSWIRKGFEEFITRLENVLKENLKDDVPIVKIGVYTDEIVNAPMYVFYVPKEKKICCEFEIERWKKFNPNTLSIVEIKRLVRSIPEVISKEIEKLKSISQDDSQIIDILKKMNSVFSK